MIRMYILALVLLIAPRLLPAVEVTGLYEAEVPVVDQRAAARGEAARAALAEVLAKVTGDADAPRRPAVQSLLQRAEQWLQRYQYRVAPGGAGQIFVASFDRQAINQRIYEAGLPVWGSNRPQILLWLAVEDGGARALVGGEQRPEVQALVADQARRHGLPVILPLLDSQEQSAPSLSEVWGQFVEPVQWASERYQSDAVLLGRIYSIGPNRWRGRWTLRHAGSTRSWEGGEGGVADVIAAGLNEVMGHFAKRYALTLAPGAGDTATLVVSEVAKLQDYARVSRYLSSLDAVSAVAVDGVEGDTLVLRLQIRGDVQGLTRLLALGKVLAPSQEGALAGADNALRYQLIP